MLWATYLLKPWAAKLASMEVRGTRAVPRAIADDIAVTARGQHARHMIDAALTATIDYIRDMGGVEAKAKTRFWASDAADRAWARARQWPATGTRIPVPLDFKDLGAHLSTAACPHGGTLARRMVRVIALLHRISFLPVGARRLP